MYFLSSFVTCTSRLHTVLHHSLTNILLCGICWVKLLEIVYHSCTTFMEQTLNSIETECPKSWSKENFSTCFWNTNASRLFQVVCCACWSKGVYIKIDFVRHRWRHTTKFFGMWGMYVKVCCIYSSLHFSCPTVWVDILKWIECYTKCFISDVV